MVLPNANNYLEQVSVPFFYDQGALGARLTWCRSRASLKTQSTFLVTTNQERVMYVFSPSDGSILMNSTLTL